MFGLAKRKSDMEIAVASSPVAMFGLGSDGRIVCWNEKMADLSGKSEKAMLGKSARGVFSIDGPEDPIRRALDGWGETTADLKLAGSGLDVTVSVASMPSGNGGTTGVVVALHERLSFEAERCVKDLATVPTPIMRIDKNFNIQYMNKAGAEMVGLTSEECVGKKCYALLKTEHCRTAECRSDQAMRRNAVQTGETVAEPAGKPIPIQYTGSPVTDENGTIVGALEYVVDVTDTKRALDDARVKEAYLGAIPTPVMVIDKNYTVVYLNSFGASLVGTTPEQAKGGKCYDVFRTPHCRTPECRCDQAMRHDEERNGETVVDPSGLNMPIRYTATPLKDEKGNIVGALEFIADISETKRLLEDSHTKVEYLNSIPTPVMVMDSEYTVQFMNPAAAGLLGSTPERLKGLKCYDLFKTPHCRTSECRCTQAMQQDSVCTGETVADPGGINLPIDYTGAPLKNAKGQIIGVLEYVVDISARKAVLEDIIHVAQEMANNNLTARAEGSYTGDFLAIARNLNRGVKSQHDAMLQVAEAIDQISSAAQQIASSSQQVAEGASEQASALEESSSSLEEMAGMIKQNADNTLQAKTLAEETRHSSNLGADAMSGMVSSMGDIKSAAESTGEIIKDINEIAFQTNLLALNAAVEAARAGDAGRGFAVVAEEVRNLAGRAKEAAKKTEELIKQSVSLTQQGEAISGDVSKRLDEITDAASKVTQIVSEITVASGEQAKGIEQINKAVAEMDKVVQSAAANAEESSSAAEELSGQSQELAAMVGNFKLDRQRSAALLSEQKARPRKPNVSRSEHEPRQSGQFMQSSQIVPFDDDSDFVEF